MVVVGRSTSTNRSIPAPMWPSLACRREPAASRPTAATSIGDPPSAETFCATFAAPPESVAPFADAHDRDGGLRGDALDVAAQVDVEHCVAYDYDARAARRIQKLEESLAGEGARQADREARGTGSTGQRSSQFAVRSLVRGISLAFPVVTSPTISPPQSDWRTFSSG